jgi:hypothetical protein
MAYEDEIHPGAGGEYDPTPPLNVRDETVLRANDAKNRTLRTFLQGVGIDVAVAVAALVLAQVDTITDKAGLIVFFTALGKTVVMAIAAYVMRQFLDRSGVPTPLPPADPGEPDNPVNLAA